MKLLKFVLLISFGTVLVFACKNTEQKSAGADTKQQIRQMEDSLLVNQKGNNYTIMAPELVRMMSDFVQKNPQDTISASYLFKAGDISRSLGKYDDAINFWQSLCEKYPDHKRAADALFLQAFTFENEVHDLDKARKLYEEFLQKYPDHPFSSNIPVILDNLGKSPEELIEAFKNNKKNK